MLSSVSIAMAALDEIRSNAEVRENALSWIGKYATELQPCIPRGNARTEFNALMKLRTADPAPTFQGFVVLLSGVLESFITRFTDEFLRAVSKSFERPLNESQEILLKHYLARSGFALQYIGAGNIGGVRFDFVSLKNTLSRNLADNDDFDLHGDVFTVRLGTCSAGKIEALFGKVGIAGPFDKDFGAHPSITRWSKDRSPTSAANYVRDSIDKLADLRNSLAHGQPTSAVDFQSVVDFCELVRAFVEAVSARIPQEA